MDKYSVVTPRVGDKCSKCGATLEQHGAVRLCPVHGSAIDLTSTNGVETVGSGDPSQRNKQIPRTTLE